MRELWDFHRRAVTVITAVAVAVAVVVASAISSSPGHREAAGSPARPTPTVLSVPRLAPPGGPVTPIQPLRTIPPATPTQIQTDAELARAESSASIAQAERETVPAPATSSVYPAVPASDQGDPTAYALAFTRELLNIDYSTQTRPALLEWVQYEEAPDTLPGVPAKVADKSLVGSLAYRGVAGAEASPVPSVAQWATIGSRTVQRVSSLAASVAPDWTQLVSTGWEPTDPLMTVMVVTGTVTVSVAGHGGPSRSFSMALTLGGARYHGGYGAVAVSAWTVV
jgi:hypothetical protein